MWRLTLFGLDLVAVSILVFGLYIPRHRRRDLVLSGGTVVVKGSATRGGGEGGLDANGAVTITGGTVLSTGVSASTSTLPSSGQGWVSYTFSANQPAGTIVHLATTSGTQIMAFRSTKLSRCRLLRHRHHPGHRLRRVHRRHRLRHRGRRHPLPHHRQPDRRHQGRHRGGRHAEQHRRGWRRRFLTAGERAC